MRCVIPLPYEKKNVKNGVKNEDYPCGKIQGFGCLPFVGSDFSTNLSQIVKYPLKIISIQSFKDWNEGNHIGHDNL